MKTLFTLRFLLAGLFGSVFTLQALAQGASLPIITSQPLSQTVKEGTRATFSVTASGPGELSYRWYREQQPLENGNSPVLNIAMARIADTGVYRVEVTNAAGTTISTHATLTVNAMPVAMNSAPTIALQPTSLVVNNGSSAIFSVTATGAPPLEYQWLKNEVPIGGATSPSLAITGVKAMDAGAYSVRISNTAGSVTSTTANLTVNVTVSLVLNDQ
jgi:hypothetical protein